MSDLVDRLEYIRDQCVISYDASAEGFAGFNFKQAIDEALAALRKTEPVAWTASLDEVRDNILNGRGPLESVLNNDQTNAVLSVFDELYAAPAREPTHRYQCCDCGRKSWDESDELSHCNFPQPNGKRCAGQMLPIAPSRESRTDHQEPELSAEQIEDWRESMRYIYSGSEYDNIDALCDMALSSLRGTVADDGATSEIRAEGFADGIEAAAKVAEKWNAHSSLPKHIRALKGASHD